MIEKPNIVLITVDSLRADAIGEHTPFVSRLARRGAYFTQAVSNATWTNPSFKSLLTSTYPLEGGWRPSKIDSTISVLEPWRTSMVEVLREHGYKTAAFLPPNPMLYAGFGFNRGFEHFDQRIDKGFYERIKQPQEFAKLRILYRKFRKTWIWPYWRLLRGLTRFHIIYDKPYSFGSILNQRILSYLRRSKNRRPFFIWVHYMDVHWPYISPFMSYPQKIESALLSNVPYASGFLDKPTHDLRLTRLRYHYNRCVNYADSSVKDLLVGMESLGFNEDNTTVALTSDHGEGFKEHGGLFHPTSPPLYDEYIHVPLILSGKSVIPDKVNRQVSLIDLAPTLLNIAGIRIPSVCRGRIILPMLDEDIEDAQREYSISEAPIFAGNNVIGSNYSIRTRDWKYMLSMEHESSTCANIELYNLTQDPHERHNLSGEKREVQYYLHSKLVSHIKWEATSALREGISIEEEEEQLTLSPEQEEEMKDRLRQLGYL